MSGIDITDFSGGMVTAVSEINMAKNQFSLVQNANLWKKKGSVTVLKTITNATNFPTDKVYDHHLIFPIHGTGDVAIIMMSDGDIYSYDGSSFTQITTSAGDRQAGAKMCIGGDKIYVFYRNFTATPTIFRRVIYWDYDAGTPAFVISGGTINNSFEIDDNGSAGGNGTGSDPFKFKSYVVSKLSTGAEESNGILAYSPASGGGSTGQDLYLKVSRTSGDLNDLRLYISLAFGTSTAFYSWDLTPQFIYEIKGGTNKSFIPFLSGKVTGVGTSIKAYTHIAGTAKTNMLTFLLDRYVNSSENYIAPGHSVRIDGKEYEIDTITYNNTDASNPYFELTLLTSLSTSFYNDHATEGEDYIYLEVEVAWHGDSIYLPLSRRYSDVLGIAINDNRPETKYTNGTGNFVVYSKNKLVTANPYWEDTYNSGDTENKPGYLSWSYITGEGQFADLLIPNTNLMGSSITASEFTQLINFRENIIAFRKAGVSRILFNGEIPFIYDVNNESLIDSQSYFVDANILIAYLNNRIKVAVLSRESDEKSQLKFQSLSEPILYDLFDIDARMFYDKNEQILYVSDDNNTDYGWICYLGNGNPVWEQVTFSGLRIFNGFHLDGIAYFIGKDGSNNFATYKYATSGTTHISDDLIISDKNYYLPMQNNFIRKLEVLYKFTTAVATVKIYLDGVLVKTEILSSKTSLGFHEIKLDRSSATRAEKFSWRLDASTMSSDFEFAGVFINRDQYTVETLKGY